MFASACLALALFGSVFSNAKDTMNYRFTVCGVPYQFKDHKIDWEFNPTYNGYREWPWQFARHRFFSDLAEYYRKTRDENAAKTFVDIVSSFIDQALPPPPNTPPGKTKSWRTIDTGIRATCWIASYASFTNSPTFTSEFRDKFVNSLKDHVARLKNPVTSNNWRIMELRGLVDVLLEFPQLDCDGTILRSAEGELEHILATQLYPDGFQFELAPSYHSILDGDYCKLAEAYRAHGRTPPKFLESGVELAFEMYAHITAPDRKCPPVNDSRKYEIMGKMEKAVELYPHRKDFLWLATDGAKGTPPDYLSYAFPYAGAVVFRDSWARDAVWGYVDMSPFGRGHQHEDKLNFLLFAYGKEMICDGGNYAYDTSDMRKYVTSTRSHNTIRIDGKDQNARRSWKWKDEMLTKKADLVFSTSPARDVAKSSFALGYGKAKEYDDAVTHTRTVEFIKDGTAPYFRITDELTSKDTREHNYEQMWHLETCELSLADDSFKADFGDGVTLEAKMTSENGKFVDMKGTKTPYYQGWMPISPPGPHEHRPIHTPVLKGSFIGSTRIETVLTPRRGKK